MSSRSEGDDPGDRRHGLDGRVSRFGSELAELSDEELERRATDSVEAYYELSEAAEGQLDKRGGWYASQVEESVDAHYALSEEAERQLDKRGEFLREEAEEQLDKRGEFLREEAEESLGFTEGWDA